MTMWSRVPGAGGAQVTVTDPSAYRCRQMWSEVLRVNLIEVCVMLAADRRRAVKWDASAPEMRRGRRPDVRINWIGTEGFSLVCRLAGLEPEAVACRARRDLATPEGTEAMRRRLSCFDREHPPRGQHDAG